MPDEPEIRLRAMAPNDWSEVADLICVSTRYWYHANSKREAFPAGPSSTRLFCEVYEALDPGCCLVAEDPSTGRLMGSCFYHPRETHISLGIMNAHPNYFGRGVARRLLKHITDIADAEQKPLRLVSSGMNLDSFSLYTRAGFVPRRAFQDMRVDVPRAGFPVATDLPGLDRVRDARPDDVPAIVDLEMQISGIRRERDYRHFLQNHEGIWRLSVSEDGHGGIDGFLASVAHPASNMLGPGAARSQATAAALLRAELDHHPGRRPIVLVPVDCPALVQHVYQWGGTNTEIHFAQVRGPFQPFDGVVLPTFMPETG